MPPNAREDRWESAGQVLPRGTRVALVTNFAPHYRVKVFEALAGMCDLDCYFYSDGGEWYWQRPLGVQQGKFRSRYLPGFWLGRVRVAPRLVTELWSRRHDVIIKCINNRLALAAAYLAARARGVPFVLWSGVWCRLTTPAQRLLFPLTRHLYRQADAVVAYGEHVRRYLVGEGTAPERIFIAPQAVDNEQYARLVPAAVQAALRRDLGVAAEDRVLLYMGRLEPGKGLEYLLAAWARCDLRNAVLVLCGCGSLEPRLRRLADRLGIAARVRFAGFVPPPETVAFYALAWALALPSITMPSGRETWGLVANEAFNQGVPLIASEAVGAVAGGLVRHLDTGLVVPERDREALAAAIQRLWVEPGLRERLGENARREVRSWTQLRMAEAFCDAAWFALRQRSGGGPS